MFVLAFHLGHGIQSAFQTLGLNNKSMAPNLKKIGIALAYFLCVLFAIIPVVMYLHSVGIFLGLN
jgi:succinate dehydrogenase / fumarate reductase cytochrome b subunit